MARRRNASPPASPPNVPDPAPASAVADPGECLLKLGQECLERAETLYQATRPSDETDAQRALRAYLGESADLRRRINTQIDEMLRHSLDAGVLLGDAQPRLDGYQRLCSFVLNWGGRNAWAAPPRSEGRRRLTPPQEQVIRQRVKMREKLARSARHIERLQFVIARLAQQRQLPPKKKSGEVAEWRWVANGFYHHRDFFPLIGQPLKLLKAFISMPATGGSHVLTHQQINKVCSDDTGTNRPHAYVSELNKSLTQLWRLKAKPVTPIHGKKAYQFVPPEIISIS